MISLLIYLFILKQQPKLSQALLNKGGTEILDTYLDLLQIWSCKVLSVGLNKTISPLPNPVANIQAKFLEAQPKLSLAKLSPNLFT